MIQYFNVPRVKEISHLASDVNGSIVVVKNDSVFQESRSLLSNDRAQFFLQKTFVICGIHYSSFGYWSAYEDSRRIEKDDVHLLLHPLLLELFASCFFGDEVIHCCATGQIGALVQGPSPVHPCSITTDNVIEEVFSFYRPTITPEIGTTLVDPFFLLFLGEQV